MVATSPPAPAPVFVLVAGEASGDLLGAELIAALRRRHADARFAGVGGPLMAAQGMQVWQPMDRLSVMGLVEVLRHLPGLLALRRDIYRRTLNAAPAAFIGIDAPDFNLGLERRLKRAGVRTVHYVSPSIMAWRERRAATIAHSADRVLCLFPMEPPIYARHGVDAQFVGHPLATLFPLQPDQGAARALLQLPPSAPVLALLPGSRLGEIRRLARDFIDAAALLRAEFPDLRIVVPLANTRCGETFTAILRARGSELAAAFTLLPAGQQAHASLSPAHQAMIAADVVLLASGTAALEAMLAKRPMVVAYRLSALTYWLVRRLRLMRTTRYSLPNLLAGRAIVPELMQDDCTPAALAAALAPALRLRHTEPALLAEYEHLHRCLCAGQGVDAAAAVASLLAAHGGCVTVSPPAD
jgi:lipid-A-disaccharide synthase